MRTSAPSIPVTDITELLGNPMVDSYTRKRETRSRSQTTVLERDCECANSAKAIRNQLLQDVVAIHVWVLTLIYPVKLRDNMAASRITQRKIS